MIDDEGEGNKKKNEKHHTISSVSLHSEVDIELARNNNESDKEGEYWSWPDKNKDPK